MSLVCTSAHQVHHHSTQAAATAAAFPTPSSGVSRRPGRAAQQPTRQAWHGVHRLEVAKHRSAVCRAAEPAAPVQQQDVRVEEVMNPRPVLLQASMSIKDAVHKMLDANVAGAPVVNEEGKIMGVLTETDVIWKGAGKPEEHFIVPPVYIGALDSYFFLRDNKAFEEETHKILAKTVGEAMVNKEKVVTVKAGMPMSDAAQLMLHHDVNLLPVIEDDSRVVGVVTRHDILRGIYASKSPLL